MDQKQRAGLWSTFLQRALPLCNDIEEAMTCADLALEDVLSTGRSLSTEEVQTPPPQPPIDAHFAFDIYNRKAQGVLNRSLQAVRGLSASARKDLESALKRGTKDSGGAIIEFIEKYRLKLAKLLTATQLASVLEGAREVAKNVPTLAIFHGAVPPPPSLEPKEAVSLIEKLEKLTGEERAWAIYNLPTNQQTYAQQALAAKEAGGPIVPPKFTPPAPPSGAPEGIHFPTIDEAVKYLAEKNVMTRDRFDDLDAAAKAKSFTVANVDSEETLTRIRDALAKNVKEGADYESFRKKVLSDVDEGTFMSDAHMEVVFRTNVQSAFSDGQMTVLQHPLVRSGFPYSAYDAIHDDRVRHNHLALEKLGIQKTNIYRNDDPVFQTFRPPWDYNDRCGWTPMTVRQAAEKGIEEAKKWLDTGVEPDEKAFVPMPNFEPPAGFQRSVSAAPLSIQLSMQSMAAFGLLIDADDYPRDKSNRFVDKLIIAEAAREPNKATELRESLPEGQRWKLDRMMGVLRAGGTIHHPKEPLGLAVDINGTVASGVWAEYARALDIHERWTERDRVRSEWKEDVEKFTKTLRDESLTTAYKKIAAINDVESVAQVRSAIDGVLKEHYDHLDSLDEQFECIGATEQEVRDVARLRHSISLDITNLVEKYIYLKKTSGNKETVSECFNNLIDTLHSALKRINSVYEEVVEHAYKRIDDEIKFDPEPPEPKEPEEGEYRSDPMLAIGQPVGGKKLQEVVHRFAHFRSKYSDTVILNVKTGIQNQTNTVQQVVLPTGTMMTVVGEDREPDGTRVIIAQVSKWGGSGQAMSVDGGKQPQDEQAERVDLIAQILFAMFGESAVDVAKELFKKQDEGISAAFADGHGPPQVRRRYGRQPGPGWRSAGITSRGVQIWIWGPNTRTPSPQTGPQPTPLNPTPQTAPIGPAQQAPPPPPPPTQPQAQQFRAGGQRARFQSQQAYQLAIAKLNAGQQLTQNDKLSLATKLTNMPTPMLRSLHTALYNQLHGTIVGQPNLTRQTHISAIKSIIAPGPQPFTPTMPSGLQVNPAPPTPTAPTVTMPSGLQVKPPAPTPKPTPVQTTNLKSTIPFKPVTTWETGKPQQGVVLNNIPFAPAPPKFWEKVKDVDLKEPPSLKPINRVGVLVQEPDGRIWIVQPTNGFGNRQHTFPGGTVEKGLTNQQNALKEIWEETGLQVEITGHAGDFEDSNNGNNGRLYIGKRIGGAPWDAKVESFIINQKTGKPAAESETVKLVTPEEASKLLHRTDDLAQLMVAHPIPLNTPTSGTGSNPLKKFVAAIAPKAEAYKKKNRVGDGYLHAIQEIRGFNAKPKVVSKSDFEAMLSQGGHIEMHRGIGGHGGKAGSVFADKFRDGDHFPGYGCFGNGTYADSSKHSSISGNASGRYAGYNGAIVRIALPKTAKIIKQSELERKVPAPPGGYKTSVNGFSNREQWHGLQAALAGYDAIEVDGKSPIHGSYGKGFFVILNRGACVVQKENVTSEKIK